MPTYYPSLVCNFRLRFDEALTISNIPDAQPQSGDVDAVSGVGAPTSLPLILRTGPDELSHVLNRVPKTASVTLPSYRQAGTFQLEFDWRELPIDPRLLRSIGVEIYAGSVSPEDFSTGMTRVEPNGTRRSILSVTDASGASRDDLMLLCGLADTWFVTHNDTGSTVKIEGRDLRGVFLDSPCDPAVLAKLDLKKDIVDVIGDLMMYHPAGKEMPELYQKNDWPDNKPPSLFDKGGLTRVRKGADGSGATSGMGGDAPNFWDVITNFCSFVGAVPYFHGRSLRVRPAASLFDQSKSTFSPLDAPFRPMPRFDDLGNPLTIRKFIYGRNIKELSFERKFTGTKAPTIQVNSYDTSSPVRGEQKLLTARWPPTSEKLAAVSGVYPSGEVSQADVIQKTVNGVRDVDQLLTIAKNLYEEIGRGELGGNCSTSVLSSFKGSNEDPDVCRIRPGDAVEFVFDTSQVTGKVPGASTVLDGHRKSFGEQVAEIQLALSGKTTGGDENLARVLVASSRSSVVGILSVFKVANVVFNWSQPQGIQTQFDFQNYFVVRSMVTPQLGQNTALPSRKIISNANKPSRGRTNPNPKIKAPAKERPRVAFQLPVNIEDLVK